MKFVDRVSDRADKIESGQEIRRADGLSELVQRGDGGDAVGQAGHRENAKTKDWEDNFHLRIMIISKAIRIHLTPTAVGVVECWRI